MLEHLIDLLSHNIISYVGVFGTLFLTGVGFPVPEDIILLAAGFVTAQGCAHLKLMIPVAMIAILGSDLAMYALGHIFGERIFQMKPFSYIFNLRRQEKIKHFYTHYGKRAVFIARFTPGLRSWLYVFAGAAQMKVGYFFLMDFLAAIISVPLFIWLGYHFDDEIKQVANYAADVKEWLFLCIFLCIAVLLIRRWLIKKRTGQSATLKPAPTPLPETPVEKE